MAAVGARSRSARVAEPRPKRVLFLSYHFPPIGGAGAQRPARFVRYLRQHGYECVVVTGPGDVEGRWTPEDQTLAAGVPPDVAVHRVPGPEPPVSSGWRHRGERWLGVEAPSARWLVDGMIAVGLEAGRDVDLVYTWMQPYETAPAATYLAGKLRKPLIADLGDPWALDEMMVYPTRLHRRRELAAMRTFLESCDAVVMSTAEAARLVQLRFPALRSKPVVAIPNGFDPADFEGPPPERGKRPFRIVHTGYLHTELGLRQRGRGVAQRLLGGSVRGADILARSHIHLLRAIDELVSARPALASAIEVHLAGVLSRADRDVAAQSPVVRMLGYLPHRETVALMRSADLLFLPMQDLPPGTRATIVPGKTYEYLAAERPILAAVPDGDARDLLVEAGNARLCRPTDSGCIAAAILGELERFRAGEPSPAPRRELVRRYEYPRLASDLAAVFDGVGAFST